jgi:hypothetical protein
MTTITLKVIERTYKNKGMHAEQALAYTLTNEHRKHDKLPFDKGSDIPEYNMSVKSGGASLMSGNFCTKTTREGIVEEFLLRTASEHFAFVVDDFSVAYVMTKIEFAEFLAKFTFASRESLRNGGKMKVQIYKQSKKMLAWFSERV